MRRSGTASGPDVQWLDAVLVACSVDARWYELPLVLEELPTPAEESPRTAWSLAAGAASAGVAGRADAAACRTRRRDALVSARARTRRIRDGGGRCRRLAPFATGLMPRRRRWPGALTNCAAAAGLDGAQALAGTAVLDGLPAGAPPQRAAMRAELHALALGIAVDGGRLTASSPLPMRKGRRLPAAQGPAAARAVPGQRAPASGGRARARHPGKPQRRGHAWRRRSSPGTGTRWKANRSLGCHVRGAMLVPCCACRAGMPKGNGAQACACGRGVAASNAQAGSERSRIPLSLCASDFEQFRLDVARRWLEQAFAELAPLARAGRSGAMADLGRAWHNLGSIQSRAGCLMMR